MTDTWYTCIYCEKEFESHNTWQSHLRSTHFLSDEEIENLKSSIEQSGNSPIVSKNDSVNVAQYKNSDSQTQNECDSDCAILYCNINNRNVSAAQYKNSDSQTQNECNSDCAILYCNINNRNVSAAAGTDITHAVKDSVSHDNSLKDDSGIAVDKSFVARLDSSADIDTLNDQQHSIPHNSSGSVKKEQTLFDDNVSKIDNNELNLTNTDGSSYSNFSMDIKTNSVEQQARVCISTTSSSTMDKNVKTNSIEQKHANLDVSSSANSSTDKTIKINDSEQERAILHISSTNSSGKGKSVETSSSEREHANLDVSASNTPSTDKSIKTTSAQQEHALLDISSTNSMDQSVKNNSSEQEHANLDVPSSSTPSTDKSIVEQECAMLHISSTNNSVMDKSVKNNSSKQEHANLVISSSNTSSMDKNTKINNGEKGHAGVGICVKHSGGAILPIGRSIPCIRVPCIISDGKKFIKIVPNNANVNLVKNLKKVHTSSGNISNKDQTVNINLECGTKEDRSNLAEGASSVKSNESGSDMPNKKGNFVLGGIFGDGVDKNITTSAEDSEIFCWSQSVHHNSKDADLARLSSYSEHKKEGAVLPLRKILLRPLGKHTEENCDSNFDYICLEQELTAKKNWHMYLGSEKKKKEMKCISNPSNSKVNEIQNFESKENKKSLMWGEIPSPSEAEEMSLSEEMEPFLTKSDCTEKHKLCDDKNELSMDCFPPSSSKSTLPKDSIIKHIFLLKHFLRELDNYTKDEIRLMLQFAKKKDLELATALNSLKNLPFPKFPHDIPRSYVDFLRRYFEKKTADGIVHFKVLYSPCPVSELQQASEIKPNIFEKREREKEMRNTILTMLHLKDCTATTEVQELLTLILDTFLTDLCMSLKHYENEKDPLNAALPVAMGCIKGVKDLRDFYVTEVVERHAVIFRECFIRYRKFLKHRRFIKKNTTYWFKKVKKFPKVSLNPQRVSSRRATRRSDYSHQNKRTATFVKPLPRSELKQSSTVFESKDTTDDEKMECES